MKTGFLYHSSFAETECTLLNSKREALEATETTQKLQEGVGVRRGDDNGTNPISIPLRTLHTTNTFQSLGHTKSHLLILLMQREAGKETDSKTQKQTNHCVRPIKKNTVRRLILQS